MLCLGRGEVLKMNSLMQETVRHHGDDEEHSNSNKEMNGSVACAGTG